MKYKLPFGMFERRLVHISEVERGLACGCLCPGCEKPLVARKGDKTSHHFAHSKGVECEHGFETALHMAAKEILKNYKKIKLPEVFIETIRGEDEKWRISKEIEVELDRVELEVYKEGIVPDVIAYIKGKPLIIEIAVTHKTGEEKVAKARKQGVSVLEINLEKLDRVFSYENLKNEIICNTENKKWLLNVKSEKYKEAAYRVSEKKVFLGDKKPYCPKGLKKWEKRSALSNMSWLEWREFSLASCAECQYCIGTERNAIGASYDRRGYPESTVVEDVAYCLGERRIDGIGSLDKAIKK